MEIEPGISVDRVDRFCYLGEVLGEKGGAELAEENRVGKAWGKFNTMAPLPTAVQQKCIGEGKG